MQIIQITMFEGLWFTSQTYKKIQLLKSQSTDQTFLIHQMASKLR